MIGFEWNYCGVCGCRLAPDDFDGICWDCDRKCRICGCELSDENTGTICPVCGELESRLEIT